MQNIFERCIARGFITPAIFFHAAVGARTISKMPSHGTAPFGKWYPLRPPIGEWLIYMFGVTAAYAIDASLMITGLILRCHGSLVLCRKSAMSKVLLRKSKQD